MRKSKGTISRQGSSYFQQAFWLVALLLGGILPQVQGQAVRAWSPYRSWMGKDVTLTWSYGETNLLSNGGFEEGRTNWITSARIEKTLVHGTNALFITQPYNAAREFVVPNQTTGVTLSYVMDTQGWFDYRDYFDERGFLTLDLLDKAQTVVLLDRYTNLCDCGWITNSVDLTPYKGERVRLTWNSMKSSRNQPAYYLDDVRLTPVPEGVEFDVWFGPASTFPQNSFKYLGRTNQPAWPLKDLMPGRSYEWRVDVIRNGQTNIGTKVWFYTESRSYFQAIQLNLTERLFCLGEPVPFQIKVIDPSGFAPLPPLNPIKLQAVASEVSAPSVKITEVFNASNGDAVEFQNVSTNLVDLSDWWIEIYQDTQTRTTWRKPIPSGSLLQPGEIFTLRQSSFPTAPWPHLEAGFFWFSDDSFIAAGVVLRDIASNIVDAAFFEATLAYELRVPQPRQSTNVTVADWWGLPYTNRPAAGKSFQRVGLKDTSSAADWVLAAASIGTNNIGLSTPFLNGHGRVAVSPQVITTTNVWNGYLHFETPASNIIIYASTTYGTKIISKASQPFDIVTDLCLAAEAPAEILENAGTVSGAFKIRLPAVQTTNVIVQLSGVTNRLVLPGEVVIPAGSEEVAVDVTPFDNELLEGTELQSLKITAFGFASTALTTVVHDDETAKLNYTQSEATIVEGGRYIFIAAIDPIPVRDITLNLRLSNTNRFAINGTVPVKAGATNVGFYLLTVNNNVLDGTATTELELSYPGWTGDIATATVLDDEALAIASSLRAPHTNGVVNEGENFTIQLDFGANFETNVPIQVTMSVPDRISVTETVKPANARQVYLQANALQDSLPNGSTNVTLRISAPPFPDTEVNVIVVDDDFGKMVLNIPPGPHVASVPVGAQIRLFTVDGKPIYNIPVTNAVFKGVAGDTLIPITGGEVAPEGIVYLTQFTVSEPITEMRLRLEIGEIAAESISFQVWSNAPVAEVRDALYDPVQDRIIIASTNSTIYALEPGSGMMQTNVITLNNPTLLTLSDDQETLHAVFAGGQRIARIKLSSFEVQADWSLGEVNGEPLVVDHLIPVPGEPESLLISRRLLSTNVLHDVAVFDGATPRTQTASIPYGLPTTLGFSTDKQKAFVTFYFGKYVVETLGVSTDGVEWVASPWAFELFSDRWARAGDHVFYGDMLFSVDLETVDPHLPAFINTLHDDGHGFSVTANPMVGHFASHKHQPNQGLQRLAVFDSFLMRELGQQTYPPFAYVNKMVPAGKDRWMYLGNNRFYLATLPTPEPAPATDLGITSEVMVIEPVTKSAHVTFRVTNNGTNVAPDTALVFGLAGGAFFRPSDIQMVSLSTNAVATDRALGGQLYELGDLAPGESKEVQGVFKAASGERLAVSAYVGSTAKELSLADNRTQVSIDNLLRIPGFSLQTNLDSQDGSLKLQFSTQAGISYQIEHSASISGPWEPHGAAITGDGEPFVLEIDTSSAATSFWRVIAH